VNTAVQTVERDATPLPTGWHWMRLGEVCAIIAGQSPPGDTYRDEPSGLPFFQGKADFGSLHPVPRKWCLVPNKVAEPGDILISVRAPVGPTNVADTRCCIGRGLAAIRPRSSMDRDYVLFALRHFENDLAALGSGSTFSAIGRRELESLLLPVPPLLEQNRIAAALREQLDAAARMRAAAEQQETCVRELTSIVVNRAFKASAADWPLRPIGQMARILSGYAFKSAWFSEEGVRLLRNANVSQGNIDWTDTVRLPEVRRSDFTEYELSVGDIVLALDRPMVAAGLKVARLAKSDVPSLLLQRVATFRLSNDLDAGYLYAFLRTRAFADAVSGHEQSLGVPHVSPKQVAAVLLPAPPIARQRDIVRALDDALGLVSSASTAVGGQAAEIGPLPAALLRSAFSG
jgi:restriction endonuclease S subunit